MTQKLTIDDLHWIGEAFKKACPGHTIQYCFVDQEGELFFSFYAENDASARLPWWFTAKTVAEVSSMIDYAKKVTTK